MGKQKIDLAKMGKMLLGGKSPQDCMKEFGCSEVAFYKARKKLSRPIIESLGKIPKRKRANKELQIQEEAIRFNVKEQLEKINKVNNQILDNLTGEKETINRMVKAVEAVLGYEKEPTQDNLKHLKATILRISQDNNTAIKASAEIRAQLSLLLDIEKQLWNIVEIKKQQEITLQIIGKVAPHVRNEIIKELREYRSRRGLVDLT